MTKVRGKSRPAQRKGSQHSRSGGKRASGKPGIGPLCHAGLILICDIVGFSKMDQPDQVAAISRLWEYLETHELMKRKYDGSINGTGDGALIAWSQRSEVVPLGVSLEFAEDLIAHMRGNLSRPVYLRIGVHIGQFLTVNTAKRLGKQLVGTGLNECARVSSLGDEGHVVLSEKFCVEWKKANHQHAIADRLYPKGDNPIVAYVKHGEPLGVRLLKSRDLNSTPEKLRRLLHVDELLHQVLTEIETAFANCLRSGASTLPSPGDALDVQFAESLATRVSILSPAIVDGDRLLCPTEYRYCRVAMYRKRGTTSYRIQHGRPEGPLAKAFVNYETVVASGLDPSSPDYSAVLGGEAGPITQDKIENMSRKPGTIIAFPFGMQYGPDQLRHSADHPEPEGVVCIDLEAGVLEKHATVDVHRVADKLRIFFNNILSSLWKLRTS